MNDTECCSICGVTANNLKHCAACRLPGVVYCSKECQRADWKRHKVDCKLTKLIDRKGKLLKLSYDHDDTKMKDYDAALKFAQKYMPNLSFLKISLSQAGMWKQREINSWGRGMERKEAVVEFSYDVLKEFLQEQSDNLESLEIYPEECIELYLHFFFKDGKILKSLEESTSLRQLALCNMQVSKISYLPLNTNIQCLRLDSVKFTNKWDGPLGWSEEDCTEMVAKISQLTALVCLELSAVPLRDHHLESMLRNLSNLKALRISGVWGSMPRDSSRLDGHITDAGCQIIANLCPNLHSLDLSNQSNITHMGARRIVEGCRRLRDLRLEDTPVSYSDAAHLLELNESKSLLVFAAGSARAYTNEDILRALKATGGRCLLYGSSVGLHEAPAHGLSELERRQMEKSRSLLIEAGEKQDNETICYDMYEHLEGVDVRIGVN